MRENFCLGCNVGKIRDGAYRKMLFDAGVREISADPPVFMSEDWSRDDVKRLADAVREDGLQTVTAHPPFGSFNQPFSTLRQSPKGLREDLAYMNEFILRCGLLGVQAIPLHTGGAMLPDAQDWEIQSAADYVKALLDSAEKAGVIIAVENTNHATAVGFYPGVEEDIPLNLNIWKFDDTERILDFVHSFDSPYVRICYDTGHSHLNGKMLPDLDAFSKEIVLFHLHDGDGLGSDSHIQPGYGNADWETLFAKIKAMPGDPVLFVEARPYFGDYALMIRELSALRDGRLLKKAGGFYVKDENTGHLTVKEAE